MMKTCFIYLLLLFVCNNPNGQSDLSTEKCHNNQPKASIEKVDQNPVSQNNNNRDEVSEITLLVNSINNYLTWGTIVLGVITLLVAIIGIIGFKGFKNDCKDDIKECKKSADDLTKQIHKKMNRWQKEVKNTKEERNKLLQEIKAIQKKQEIQNQYIGIINKYLNEIITQTTLAYNHDKALEDELFRKYHLIDLFSNTSNTFDDFSVLKQKGTMDDINALEFIAEHDADEIKRKMAQETIGFIKGRLDKKNTIS